MARNQELGRTAVEHCAGLNEELSDRRVYAIAWDAAKSGDTVAGCCYVYAGFHMTDAMHHDPRQLAEYQRNAPILVDEGVRRGDWSIVDILWLNSNRNVGVDAVDPSWRFTLSPDIPAGAFLPLGGRRADTVSFYRYMRLRRFGATPEYGVSLDKELAELATNLLVNIVKAQDAIAEDLYRRYFTKSKGRTGHENDICEL